MTRRSKPRTALFAGSFNPMTNGHLRLIERALYLFDRIVVGVGVNPDKMRSGKEVVENIEKIERAVRIFDPTGKNPRVEVHPYTGLTASFAREVKADVLLRGIRSVSDFEYERNLADVNLKLLGIDTYFLIAEPEYSYLSSSVVRELKANGCDVSPLIP